jgi:hypothetical protein
LFPEERSHSPAALSKLSLLHEEHSHFSPILHTAWLNNHALTLKRNTAKYYFGEKSSFWHTFLIVVNQGKFKSNSKTF